MNGAANTISRHGHGTEQHGFGAEWLLQLALVGAALVALAQAAASLNGAL
jgi:hypothetical protein